VSDAAVVPLARARDELRGKRILEGATGRRFESGHTLRIHEDGEIFPALIRAIDEARLSVELVVYIWSKGDVGERLGDALLRASARGVSTRILVDAFGGYSMPRALRNRLLRGGVDLRFFRPLHRARFRFYQRTHRKILVCDATRAFTGGFGVAPPWTGPWRDLHYEVEGPSVRALRASFLHEWMEVGAAMPDDVHRQPTDEGGVEAFAVSSVSTPGHSAVSTVFRASLRAATERLRIVTPYFVPDDATVTLLRDTRRRGVEVDVVVPGDAIDHPISRWAGEGRYAELFDMGIRIHRYRDRMIHSKILLVDDALAVVGSANFNHRSMRHDDEVVLVVHDRGFVSAVDAHVDRDLERAVQIEPASWAKRGLLQRAKEAVALVARPQV